MYKFPHFYPLWGGYCKIGTAISTLIEGKAPIACGKMTLTDHVWGDFFESLVLLRT